MEALNGHNSNHQRHGYWIEYFSNGNIWYSGHFINGDKDGYWEWNYYNGDEYSSGYYINDIKTGYWEVYENGKNLISFYIR